MKLVNTSTMSGPVLDYYVALTLCPTHPPIFLAGSCRTVLPGNNAYTAFHPSSNPNQAERFFESGAKISTAFLNYKGEDLWIGTISPRQDFDIDFSVPAIGNITAIGNTRLEAGLRAWVKFFFEAFREGVLPTCPYAQTPPPVYPEDRAVQLFLRGKVTPIQEEMLHCLVGTPTPYREGDPGQPAEPATGWEFCECLNLISQIPSLTPHIPELGMLSRGWRVIASNWEELKALADGEISAGAIFDAPLPRTDARLLQLRAEAYHPSPKTT